MKPTDKEMQRPPAHNEEMISSPAIVPSYPRFIGTQCRIFILSFETFARFDQ
jgi:hypothetical protein